MNTLFMNNTKEMLVLICGIMLPKSAIIIKHLSISILQSSLFSQFVIQWSNKMVRAYFQVKILPLRVIIHKVKKLQSLQYGALLLVLIWINQNMKIQTKFQANGCRI